MIELLVVVSIIALLIAMLLPAIRQVKELSKRSTCASQLHQITLACFAYASDHDGNLPPFRQPGELSYGVCRRLIYNGVYVSDHNWLSLGTTDYLATWHVFFCPSNTWSMDHGGARQWLWDHQHVAYHYLGGPNSFLRSGDNVPPEVGYDRRIYDAIFGMELDQPSVVPLLSDIITEPLQGHEPEYSSYSHLVFDPQGGNVAYVDGHIVWRDHDAMYVIRDGGTPWYRF